MRYMRTQDVWCSTIEDEGTEDILDADTLEKAKQEFLERYYTFCESKVNYYKDMMDWLITKGV